MKNVMRITLLVSLGVMVQHGFAGTVTWNINPVDNDWTNPANWTPATVPNALTDVATFGATAQPSISIPSDITVGEIVFNPGASAYTFTVAASSPAIYFTIAGAGVTNNSGILQHINTPPVVLGKGGIIVFSGRATAGDNVAYEAISSYIYFYENSSLGNATVTVDAGIYSLTGSTLSFNDDSTAATGTIVLNGATGNGAYGGSLSFSGNANLARAHLIAYGGTGGERGATAKFIGASKSGAATVEVYGNATFDLTLHYTGDQTIIVGSLLGDGVIPGGSYLGVGKHDLDSNFSGNWATGVCVKTGRGTLTWSSPPINGNTTYIVQQGTLLFTDPDGTGRGGNGPVTVRRGRLGGDGAIKGLATIGDGTGSGDARLAPGLTRNDTAVLTIEYHTLVFNADGLYECNVDFNRSTADQVIANGVTILSGATFLLAPTGTGTLPVGTAFTVIDNAVSTPISGTFANLPEGGILTANGTNFQASYTGGDGNDLTLTVIQ